MIKTVQAPNDIFTVSSNTKVFETKSRFQQNYYLVNIEFPSCPAYNVMTYGFIDTGAANTAITIKALYKQLRADQYQIIMNALSMRQSTSLDFSSAKGYKDIRGWLCVLPEIDIAGYRINNFPFYLVDNLEKPLVLIGYDFTSSCDMVQLKDEPISFYNFDINSMYSKMNGSNPLNLLSLGI